MKAELALTDLQRYLRVLSAVAASNIKSRYTPPPVISIDVSGPAVTLTAATWQITGQLTLAGGMSDGSAAVEATQLSAAINAIAPPRIRRTTMITLAGVPGHLHVSGAATVTLGANSDWTAPQLPQQPQQQHVVRMPARDWTNTVSAVMRAIDKRDARHVHGGLRLYREPGCALILEATDRMRIHRQVIGDPQPGPHESRLALTPAKLLLRLLALAGDTDQVTVGYGDDTLLAVSGLVTVAAKAPAWDGWPDVQIVLEHSIEHGAAFTVNSNDMGEALRAARAMADPANPHIDLDLDPAGQQISLLVPGRDRPLLTQLIAVAQVRGPRQQFGLRADHASDVFTAITVTTLTLPEGAQPARHHRRPVPRRHIALHPLITNPVSTKECSCIAEHRRAARPADDGPARTPVLEPVGTQPSSPATCVTAAGCCGHATTRAPAPAIRSRPKS